MPSDLVPTPDWEAKAFQWGYDKTLRETIASEIGVALRELDGWLTARPAVEAAMKDGARERDLRDVGLAETAVFESAIGAGARLEESRKPDGRGGFIYEKTLIPGKAPDGKLALEFLERRGGARWDKKVPSAPPPVSKNTVMILDGRLAERGMRSLDQILRGEDASPLPASLPENNDE